MRSQLDYGRTTRYSGDDGRVNKITYQGDWLEWKYLGYPRPGPEKHERGKVETFSAKSRLRMLCWLNRLAWHEKGNTLFVTLTFPDGTVSQEKKVVHQYLYLWHRYLEKHVGKNVPVVWRLEFEPRKSGVWRWHYVPHFHLLLFGVKYIHHSRIKEWWNKALGFDGYVRTDIGRPRNRKQVWAYIAKYCAKRDGSLVIGPYLNNPFPGRRWGILRRSDLPLAELHSMREFDCEYIEDAYFAALQANPHIDQYNNKSFTLLGESANEIGDFIFMTDVDGEMF